MLTPDPGTKGSGNRASPIVLCCGTWAIMEPAAVLRPPLMRPPFPSTPFLSLFAGSFKASPSNYPGVLRETLPKEAALHPGPPNIQGQLPQRLHQHGGTRNTTGKKEACN